ncbi:MAG: dephospho-CoA kinase [Gammaproteobacteria bacterium]|nr:dephospho-CoA kinase [Gammaproteobacteria bacterium]
MLVIGLTGGIGSGKSAVCHLFEKLGVPIVDADVISHELTQPDQPAVQKIIDEFGSDVLDASGALDRAKLRQIVFSDPKKRFELESILHPLVLVEIHTRIQAMDAPYCIVCIPLLLETEMTENIDRILVVDSPEALQISRTQARDNLSPDEIKQIMSAQASRAERLKAANDVIINDSDMANLEKQVTVLHKTYLEISAS